MGKGYFQPKKENMQRCKRTRYFKGLQVMLELRGGPGGQAGEESGRQPWRALEARLKDLQFRENEPPLKYSEQENGLI